MATVQLTDRQQEVHTLLDKNKTPREIAGILGISENAVYQHMRRIREKDGKPKPRARKPGVRRAKHRGSRTRRTTPRAGLLIPPEAAPEPQVPKMPTPLQAIQARKRDLESELKASEEAVAAARKTLASEEESHAKLTARRKDELTKLTRAEAALRGEKAKSARNGSGSRKAAQEAAQAAPAPTERPPAPAPEPERDEFERDTAPVAAGEGFQQGDDEFEGGETE